MFGRLFIGMLFLVQLAHDRVFPLLIGFPSVIARGGISDGQARQALAAEFLELSDGLSGGSSKGGIGRRGFVVVGRTADSVDSNLKRLFERILSNTPVGFQFVEGVL